MTLDTIFVIDTTASMASLLSAARSFMVSCLNQIKSDMGIDVRTSIIEYRDHPPEDDSYASKIRLNREGDLNKVNKLINRLDVYGGGDTAESGLDGIVEIANLDWLATSEKSIKLGFLIGDAPILGTPECRYHYNATGIKEGVGNDLTKNCRCGLTTLDAIRLLENYGVTVCGYVVGNHRESKDSFANVCSSVSGVTSNSVFKEVLDKVEKLNSIYIWSTKNLYPILLKDPRISISDICEKLNVSSDKVHGGIELLNRLGITKNLLS